MFRGHSTLQVVPMTTIARTEPPLEAVTRLTPLIQQYADESESAWMLAFLMPAEVRRSFMMPPWSYD